MALAHKGTLFLDELSSFPLPLQSKILRAVEEKAIYPVGEHSPEKVDFRVITATNQDPQELIQTEKLREDLYHRLATVEISIPPLRERKEDMETLVLGLLHQLSQKENKSIGGISKRLFKLLLRYSYPGNVRELSNILRAMMALAHPGEILDIHMVPEKLLGPNMRQQVDEELETRFGKGSLDLRSTVDEVTKRMILHSLKAHRGNITKAAGDLNVTIFGLRKMMKRLGITKDQ